MRKLRRKLREISEEDLLLAVQSSRSRTGICRYFNLVPSTWLLSQIQQMLDCIGADTSHFYRGNTKKFLISKVCPVCSQTFETTPGKREKVVCSHSCSNTYFRSAENNPNWKDKAYRTTCFAHHPKKCVICDEDLLLDVHHYDEDKNNNTPENLIPLCATHHRYWHSRYRHLIQDKVDLYRENFMAKS